MLTAWVTWLWRSSRTCARSTCRCDSQALLDNARTDGSSTTTGSPRTETWSPYSAFVHTPCNSTVMTDSVRRSCRVSLPSQTNV